MRVPEAEAIVAPWPSGCEPVWGGGMPAHVTLLFPFLTLDRLDEAGRADLAALFASTPAVEVTFGSVGRFPEVVYLAPEPRAWFVALTRALSSHFGLLPYGGQYPDIVPHLTVVQHPDPAALDEIAASLGRHLQLVTTVREVWLMEQEPDGPWHLAATFPLRKW